MQICEKSLIIEKYSTAIFKRLLQLLFYSIQLIDFNSISTHLGLFYA